MLPDIDFDAIITVCDDANEQCPYFPGKATRLHYNFPDPAKLSGSEEEIMQHFRNIRDQIKAFSKRFVVDSDKSRRHLNKS